MLQVGHPLPGEALTRSAPILLSTFLSSRQVPGELLRTALCCLGLVLRLARGTHFFSLSHFPSRCPCWIMLHTRLKPPLVDRIMEGPCSRWPSGHLALLNEIAKMRSPKLKRYCPYRGNGRHPTWKVEVIPQGGTKHLLSTPGCSTKLTPPIERLWGMERHRSHPDRVPWKRS